MTASQTTPTVTTISVDDAADTVLDLMAKAVRDAQAATRNALATRINHPSYIGKTQVRAYYQHAVSIAGAYMLLAGQASHTMSGILIDLDGVDLRALRADMDKVLGA